jgi:cell division GTPase FtsZ
MELSATEAQALLAALFDDGHYWGAHVVGKLGEAAAADLKARIEAAARGDGLQAFGADHSGRTVTGYSVVVARDAEAAKALVVAKLAAAHITDEWREPMVKLTPIDTSAEGVTVLWDGEP